jgi:hypothetical protein
MVHQGFALFTLSPRTRRLGLEVTARGDAAERMLALLEPAEVEETFGPAAPIIRVSVKASGLGGKEGVVEAIRATANVKLASPPWD